MEVVAQAFLFLHQAPFRLVIKLLHRQLAKMFPVCNRRSRRWRIGRFWNGITWWNSGSENVTEHNGITCPSWRFCARSFVRDFSKQTPLCGVFHRLTLKEGRVMHWCDLRWHVMLAPRSAALKRDVDSFSSARIIAASHDMQICLICSVRSLAHK